MHQTQELPINIVCKYLGMCWCFNEYGIEMDIRASHFLSTDIYDNSHQLAIIQNIKHVLKKLETACYLVKTFIEVLQADISFLIISL